MLGALRGHDSAGALLLRLERSPVGLDAISDALDSAGCDTTRRRLMRVFETHYVGQVQPDLAALDRSAGPMRETLARIYQASLPDGPPPSMQAFYEEGLVSQPRRPRRLP
jgi:hypothetical protein